MGKCPNHFNEDVLSYILHIYYINYIIHVLITVEIDYKRLSNIQFVLKPSVSSDEIFHHVQILFLLNDPLFGYTTRFTIKYMTRHLSMLDCKLYNVGGYNIFLKNKFKLA